MIQRTKLELAVATEFARNLEMPYWGIEKPPVSLQPTGGLLSAESGRDNGPAWYRV
jgi:hypothetical protein